MARALATINGKSAEVYKTYDIKKVMSDKVSTLLNGGYVMNFVSMGGSQSNEEGHVDLSKDGGKTVVRVYLTHNYSSTTSCHVLSVVEEKHSDCEDTLKTLWNGRGEILSKDTFYSLGKDRDFYHYKDNLSFVKDENILADIDNLRSERFYKRNQDKIRKISPTKTILDIVHKRKGYGKVKLSDIDCVKKFECNKNYRIDFKNGKNPIYIG